MLRVCVKYEKRIQFLLTVCQWHQEGIEKVPLVEIIELLVPCILHLENRVGEKLLNMILRFGFQKRQQSPSAFIAEIQEVFRKEVLGSPECPPQWKLPFKEDSDGSIQLEPIQERNTVVRGMVNDIDKILENALPESEQNFKAKLIVACFIYCKAMEILTLHRALTDEEVDRFQDLVDDFFET